MVQATGKENAELLFKVAKQSYMKVEEWNLWIKDFQVNFIKIFKWAVADQEAQDQNQLECRLTIKP